MILRARIDCNEETCSNQEKKLIWKWDGYNMGITSNIHVFNLDRPGGGEGLARWMMWSVQTRSLGAKLQTGRRSCSAYRSSD